MRYNKSVAQKGTLIIDIDSSSVGACILTNVDGRPTLSQVKRVPVGTGATTGAAALIPLLKEALPVLLKEYGTINPSHVFVTLASPWFSATLRTLASRSEKPVRISTSTVQKIVTDHKTTEHPAGLPLESLPITVSINGYRTRVRRPVSGTTLAVTLYESAIDEQCARIVKDAVRAVAPHAKLIVHSTPIVYAEVCMTLSNADYATIVDVGGEQSDIVLLSHGTIAFVGSLPEGSRSVARTVASALAGKGEGSLVDAQSRLAMLAGGELADAETQATAAALTNAATSWRTSFMAMLAQIGNTVPVPHRIIAVGESDDMRWFTRVIAGVSQVQGAAVHPGEPELIAPEFFGGAVSFGEGGVYDGSLALAALFFHMRHGKHTAESAQVPVLYSVQ